MLKLFKKIFFKANSKEVVSRRRDFRKRQYFKTLDNLPLVTHPVEFSPYAVWLTCVIVEPRTMESLRRVIHNMAHVYGKQVNVGLMVFHGTHNKTFVHQILAHFPGSQSIQLPVQDLNQGTYSNLLMSKWFWRNLSHSQWALVFQTDSVIFRPIPLEMFHSGSDFTGAAWQAKINTDHTGNGGFSLRKVREMIRNAPEELFKNETSEWEDQFYSRVSTPGPYAHCCEISTEVVNCHTNHLDTVGAHQPYHALWSTNEWNLFLQRMLTVPSS
jgi:hypothetical protein